MFAASEHSLKLVRALGAWGRQRATISLVVIMMEGTANVHYLLPLVW